MINISFTGHRPDKLGGYDWNSTKNKKIREKIREVVTEVIGQGDGTEKFKSILGGALGIDQFGADVMFDLRDILPNNVFVEIAVPFKD